MKGGKGGKYCADEIGRVVCDRGRVGGWEVFTYNKQGTGSSFLDLGSGGGGGGGGSEGGGSSLTAALKGTPTPGWAKEEHPKATVEDARTAVALAKVK